LLATRERVLSSSKSARHSIAFSPAGVAAQPSPRIFDKKFSEIYLQASDSRGSLGNKNLITGRIFPESFSTIPDSCAIFISPDHIATTPAIEIHKVTASFPEDTAASVTVLKFPVRAPYIIPIRIIPLHKYVIPSVPRT